MNFKSTFSITYAIIMSLLVWQEVVTSPDGQKRRKIKVGRKFSHQENPHLHFDVTNQGRMKTNQPDIKPNQIIKKRIKSDPINPGLLPDQSFNDSFRYIHYEEDSAKNRSRNDSRFLSLFTIVRFPNDFCNTSTGVNGTCYSSSDCSRIGGTASGNCASGFGVCCRVTQTCGGSLANNCTYFQSTGYPSTFSTVGSCQITVSKVNSNICQFRLEFDNFVLSQPDVTDNNCVNDQLIVTAGSTVPAICGTNTGQHIYVDAGSGTQIILSVATRGATFPRSFSIRVCQIECNSLTKVPSGCLQYFTGVSGQVQSFNYISATGLMLSSTNYGICIRQEVGFCGIQYTACPDTINTVPMSFSVSGGSPAQGSVVGEGVPSCVSDWLTIICASNVANSAAQSGTPSRCVDRLCGMVFNSVNTPATSPSVPVFSFSLPFNIYVRTNAVESSTTPADFNNRGFCLNYVQQPCTSTTTG